jgi:peptidoglycan/LPS O-acetylase OafA/YrhL
MLDKVISNQIPVRVRGLKYTYSDLAGKRIFGLDLVRSIAVCAVVFAHTGYERIFGFRYGVIAIEYFFVMSGFLVGEMLIREFYTASTWKTLVNFWIKRWFRTLPLYYLILILKIFLTPPAPGTQLWPYFLFLQNNIGGISFYAVSWTLVIEEWFYLFMPLLVFILFRNGMQRQRFILLTIVVIISEIILRTMYISYKDVPWAGIVGNFPFRFDSFMIGVAIAFVKVEYKKTFSALAAARVFIPVSLLFIMYLIFFAASGGGELSGTSFWVRTSGFAITSIFMALQMPFLNNSTLLNSINDNNRIKQALTWLSLLSYPIYLIHIDFLHFFSTGILLADLMLNYSIIILLSYLLIVFFHQPVTSARTKFLIK